MKEVTLLIRTFNSEKTVQTTLDSALEQTLPKDEYDILVIDDGSTDQTKQVLHQYVSDIILLSVPHVGPIGALNSALREVSTPYFIILDSDDKLEKDALTTLLAPLLVNPGLGFTYCDYFEHTLNQQTQTVTTGNIFNTIAGGILFDTVLVKENGGYDSKLFFPEYDLLVKLLQKVPGLRIPKPLYHYIRRSGSVTDDSAAVEAGRQQLFAKYGQQFPIRNYTLS